MHRLRSSGTRKNQRSSSSNSPLPGPLRTKVPNVVPSGTVASRIYFLESNARASPTTSRRPSSNRDEDSRFGFGRRVTNRFAMPASRNEYPDEEARVNATIHGFVGFNHRPTSHLKVHGITDGGADSRRTTYGRASGIHAQIQPYGSTERAQYDALSPWSVTPQYASTTLIIDQYSQNTDSLPRSDSLDSKTSFPKSSFPAVTDGAGTTNNNTGHDTTFRSEISGLTTSTVRRQSVRDLFADYGIERPPGLVSDKLSPKENDISAHSKGKIRCVYCSWYNPEASNWCVKCKFFIRKLKHEESYPSLISPRGEQYYLEKASDEKPLSSPVTSSNESERTQATEERHLPQPSNVTTKFPSFNMAQTSIGTEVTSPQKVSVRLAEPPLISKSVKGGRNKSLVKESPFLIADRLFKGGSSKVSLSAPRLDGGIYCRASRSKLHLHQEAVSSNTDCESSACRATHEHHEPYRHSVACLSEKDRTLNDTDTGYVADTSFVEDPDPNLYNLPPASNQVERHGSEYIECHGYPRTGHDRHGSATSAVGGQCQHCIDDCECSACQKTHHSVRCCMNDIHSGISHQHHTPRTEGNLVNPLECPTFSLESSQILSQSKPSSSSRKVSKALPAPSLDKNIQPPTTRVSLAKLKLESLSRKSIEKTVHLPVSQRSTFARGGLRSLTPPIWAVDSNLQTKTPSTTAVSTLRASRAAADTSLDMRAISEPVPQSGQRSPILPPPIPGVEKSPECCSLVPPESYPRAMSKQFSDLFQSGEKTTITLLDQRLMEHQEDFTKIEKECDDMVTTLSNKSEDSSQKAPLSAVARGKQMFDRGSAPGKEEISIGGTSDSKPQAGVSLADKKFPTPCQDDASVQEHNLSDDVLVDEKGEEVQPSAWAVPTKDTSEESHDCVWKRSCLDKKTEMRSRKQDNAQPHRLTIIVHMKGKEDLIIETDLQNGREGKMHGH